MGQGPGEQLLKLIPSAADTGFLCVEVVFRQSKLPASPLCEVQAVVTPRGERYC